MSALHWLLQAQVGVVIALCIDQWIGEPSPRWHPVVWMGRYLQCAGRRLQQRVQPHAMRDLPAFWRGAAYWCMGALLTVLPACLLQWLLWRMPWGIGTLLMGLALKPLLAWRMLTDEVQAVEQQLAQSLPSGRQQLARIVSRDVSALNAAQVRESAIESLAENLNDSVVAPLLWFLLLSLPGAALYRYADTADSMWGYRGHWRGHYWEWAGKWAARADDALAWLPARLTALALLLANGLQGKQSLAKCGQLSGQLPAQARRTPSPNSGWPMAAMALALNVCLHKPHVYTLHATGNAPQAKHIPQAVRLANRSVILAVTAGVLAAWLIGGIGAIAP